MNSADKPKETKICPTCEQERDAIQDFIQVFDNQSRTYSECRFCREKERIAKQREGTERARLKKREGLTFKKCKHCNREVNADKFKHGKDVCNSCFGFIKKNKAYDKDEKNYYIELREKKETIRKIQEDKKNMCQEDRGNRQAKEDDMISAFLNKSKEQGNE